MRRLDKVGNWKGVDRPKTHSYKMFSPFHCFFFTPNFYPIPTLEFCIQRITFLIFRGTFPTVRRPRQSRIAAHRPAPGRLLHGARPAPGCQRLHSHPEVRPPRAPPACAPRRPALGRLRLRVGVKTGQEDPVPTDAVTRLSVRISLCSRKNRNRE